MYSLRSLVFMFVCCGCLLIVQAQRRGRQKNKGQKSAVTLPPVFAPTKYSIGCEERVKCDTQAPKSFYESNCFCDDLCSLYDDCCSDHVSNTEDMSLQVTKKMVSCTRVREIDPEVEINMVTQCPKDFPDEYIKSNCETDAILETDQFLNLPVSGYVTRILYKNYYCAVCAGEKEEEISFWHVKVGCGGMPQAANASDSINVIETTLQGSMTTACSLEYFHPNIETRKCKSNIDRCPQTWNGNKKIAKKCKRSSSAFVYAGLEVFRNKFCAQCYEVNETYLTCIDPRTPKRGGENEVMGLVPPFSVLLDVNTGSGSIQEVGADGTEEVMEQVAQVRQCPQYHVYDPFVQTCRRLRCAPGMEFLEGICVPTDAFETPSPPPIDEKYTVGTEPQAPGESDQAQVVIEAALDADDTTDKPTEDTKKAEQPSEDELLEQPREAEAVMPEPEPPVPDRHNEDGLRPEMHIPDDTLKCPVIQLNSSEYFILANNSAYIYKMNKAIAQDDYVVIGDDILLCLPSNWDKNSTANSNNTSKIIMFKFDRYQDLVSFVGLLVSLTALLILFIVYMMLAPLRNVPGKCIISLVVALFVAQGLFLAGNHVVHIHIACLSVSAVMHYAFLAAFFWLNVMAIDICRTFKSSNIGSPTEGSGNVRFACYSLYAWFAPAVIVGGSVAMDMLGMDEFEPYRPYYADDLCWITRRMALLYLFALPVAVILVINIFLYFVTLVQICRLSHAIKLAQGNHKQERHRFLLYVKLSFVMGLTWVFGYLAALTELWYMWYVFIVFNTLQGAFICFAFVCTRRVLKLLKERGRVHRSTDGNYYMTSSTTSTTLRSGYTRQTYLYDGDAKIISQETSI